MNNSPVKSLKFGFATLNAFDDRITYSISKSTRTLFYKDIISVEYYKPSLILNGSLKFITANSESESFRLTLKHGRKSESEDMYNYIMQKLSEIKSA